MKHPPKLLEDVAERLWNVADKTFIGNRPTRPMLFCEVDSTNRACFLAMASEECDGYYRRYLTKDQMRKLIEELQQLIDKQP